MKNLLFGLILLGFTTLAQSQIAYNFDPIPRLYEFTTIEATTAPDVLNAEYLNTISINADSKRVKSLENKVARYNITKQSVYNKKTKTYTVDFKETKGYKGRITATYDENANLIKSYERFQDIRLPFVIRNSVNKTFPGSIIKSNTYVATYSSNGKTSKLYKVKFEHEGITQSLKVDSKGNIL